MDNFKQFLVMEFDARTSAELRVGASGDKSERMQDARMSDQALAKKRAVQIRDQQQSDDPLDRQIAQLQKRIDQLLMQKKTQGGE